MKMSNKKAQGISMNVIVIAAIALLVLVVLVMIFTGRMSIFSSDIKGCTAQGGFCTDSCTQNAVVEGTKYNNLGQLDCGNNRVCCQGLKRVEPE